MAANIIYNDEELFKLADRMRYNLDIRDRVYHLKIYSNCFVGTDAVKLIINLLRPPKYKSPCTVETAELIGQAMIEKNIIHHVCREQPFHNKCYYYRFSDVMDLVGGLLKRMNTVQQQQQRIRKDDDDDDDDDELHNSNDDDDDDDDNSSDDVSSLDSTGTGDHHIISHDDFMLLSISIKLVLTIEIKDRIYHLKNYHDCFVGREATDLIMKFLDPRSSGSGSDGFEGGSPLVEKAIRIGQDMMDKGIIYHVCREHAFENKELFYRFATPDEVKRNPFFTVRTNMNMNDI